MVRPVVRLVVLNFNGGAHLERCVEHLEALDWPADRLEIVVVDNASTDGSPEQLETQHPRARLIRSPVNTGFPANNLALRDLDGVDYVGLVNNDAFVTPGYLQPLVAALETDPSVGAACPKILLAPRFVDLVLEAPSQRVPGDERDLALRISGARAGDQSIERDVVFGDGVWDAERGGLSEPRYRWTSGRALVRVPLVSDAPVELRLAADQPVAATASSGGERRQLHVGTTPAWHGVPAGGQDYDVINNAGSKLIEGGWGADRGFLERDEGQYDEPQDVFAWCGAGVLFRPAYLEDAGLFDERFFMYYEDTDLAWRGQTKGWRYRYVPEAVLRHLHAATSVEGSTMFNHYVERNRLLMLAKNAPARYTADAVWRYVRATLSYGRRDIVRPLLRGRRPSPSIVRARVASLLAFLRLLPAMVLERRRAGPADIHPEAVLGWAERR